MNKKLLSIITTLCLFVVYLSFSSSSTGITGQSTSGCSCHGAASANTIVSITGFPANYVNGQAYPITLTITNSLQSEAGFDLSVTGGTLSNAPVGTALFGTTELRHTTPKALVGGTTSWSFTWTAPATGSTSRTMSVAGNAANNDGGTGGDAYNLFSLVAAGPAANVIATAVSSNVTCFGASNGIIGAFGSGGSSPYTFSLNGGTYQSGAAFNNLAPGVYTLTAKDANNNTGTIVKTITQPTLFTASTTSVNILCFGSTGTVTAIPNGGTSPYVYSWAPITSSLASITNANAGTYTCTITDANGCTATSTAFVSQPSSGITATSATTMVTCNGGNNGSATITGTGGNGALLYAWSGGLGSNATASNLVAGIYTCTITDANSCTKTITVTIGQPTNPISCSALLIANVSCNGLTDGSAECFSAGTNFPYSFLWSPGGFTNTNISGLASATYTCVVTDGNGCTNSSTVAVTQPAVLSATIASNNKVNCKGDNDGYIALTATGGTQNYTYSWLPNTSTSNAITNLAPNNYVCTITDANGCTTSISKTIAPSTDTANATFTKTSNTLFAAQPNASYQWLTCNPFAIINNATQQNFTITKGDSYALVVTSGTCKDTSACQIITPLSIAANVISQNKLYINDLQNYIFENNTNDNQNYKIVNAQGALIQQGKFGMGKNGISTIGFANGIYIVIANNDKFKLVVSK
jgi:hypothetical protein